MQILLQITQQNNELKTWTRRNGTRRSEGAVPSTLELNGRARQSLNLNRRPLTKLRDFSITEFRRSSRRFERDNAGSGDGSHERFSTKRNNPRQEGSQKWSFVVMTSRDASLLAPFYTTSQPKKKKKLFLLWKIRRLFWSGDVNEVRVAFMWCEWGCWGATVLFCILTFVLVDSIRPVFLFIYHAPNGPCRSQPSATYCVRGKIAIRWYYYDLFCRFGN